MPPRTPTMKDVAVASSVAISTVSLALRQPQRVRESTRLKVLAAAAELGYQIDPRASYLASQRHHQSEDRQVLIGILRTTPQKKQREQGNFTVARQRATELGFQLEEIEIDEADPERERRLSREWYHRGMQGVILGNIRPLEYLPNWDWDLFSVVGRGSTGPHRKFHSVRTCVFENLKTLIEVCVSKGYRRIGVHVTVHPVETLDDLRRIGAVEALASTLDAEILMFKAQTRGSFVEWVKAVRPEVFLGFSIADYFILQQAGLRVPEDLAFAAYLGDATSKHTGEIAFMDLRQSLVSATAVELLDQQIRYGRKGIPEAPQHLVVSSRFMPGQTLPDRDRSGLPTE